MKEEDRQKIKKREFGSLCELVNQIERLGVEINNMEKIIFYEAGSNYARKMKVRLDAFIARRDILNGRAKLIQDFLSHPLNKGKP